MNDLNCGISDSEARRIEPGVGVSNELKYIPGVTTLLMLVVLGENGIKSIEDLAACATDDLYGWIEVEPKQVIRHDGILARFRCISRNSI